MTVNIKIAVYTKFKHIDDDCLEKSLPKSLT